MVLLSLERSVKRESEKTNITAHKHGESFIVNNTLVCKVPPNTGIYGGNRES